MIRMPVLGRALGVALPRGRAISTSSWCQAAWSRPAALNSLVSPAILTASSRCSEEPSRSSSHGKMAVALAVAAATGMMTSQQPARCEDHEVKPAVPTLQTKCIAEAIGTGLIVLLGCGVVCASKYMGSGLGVGHLAGVWGMSVMLAIFATRDVSGAHLNPAVTAALAVHKDFPKEEVLPYVAAQTFGAAVAAAANYVICRAGIAALEVETAIVRGTAASQAIFNGAFGMAPNLALISPFGALAAEILMTGVLVFMVFSLTDDKRTVPGDAAPVLIGATVAVLVSIFGPITGCGMNPARDLGPRLVTMCAGWGAAALPMAWIYTLGPVIGAVLGGAAYQALMAK